MTNNPLQEPYRQHHFQENYSGHNPVPTIQGYQENVEKWKDEVATNNLNSPLKNSQKDDSNSKPNLSETTETKPLNIDHQQTAQLEKQEMMKKMSETKEKPTKALKLHDERIVKDPVTGKDVTIRDAAFEPNKVFPTDDLTKHISPSPINPGNICLQPLPPPIPSKLLSSISNLINNISNVFIISLGVIWLSTAFGFGIWVFFWRTGLIGTAALISICRIGLLSRNIDKEMDRVRFEMHRQRGIQYSPPTPESTEWLNAFISTFMGLINPEMFLPLADTIEDVMQASLPSFVDAVKISDIGQGDTPFRILSMRALPDRPQDPEYPRSNWIKGDYSEEELIEKEFQEEPSGNYVNYEVAFAYQAQPGESDKLRSHNIHLMIEFFVGVFDWIHIPIPVWIQIEGLSGTVRLRLQMIPEMPYVRNLTFTMMGVPKIAVSAKPMLRAIPNILDLPVISGFVQSSIAAAFAEYVAPKSMTMNLQEMLSGPGVKDTTHAHGVIMVTIHHANGLSAQDANGYSDPYIVLAYSKFGKPLYSTRIIREDLNPVFEETAFLLLSDDEVKAREELSVMLWDSDERSADDLVGRIQLPISQIMQNPNQMHKRTDRLRGFQDADDMPGKLTWSVGYFSKAILEPMLQEDQMSKSPPETIPPGVPIGPKTPGKHMVVSTINTPPNRKWKSGILSVVIHHINQLERANLKGAMGDREGAQGQDTAAPSEQDDNLPSAYCEIIVNDSMIYKTRVKQYTTMPFFEAGTEHFVRDWTETIVRIAVRDSRLREKDPLLGVINIDLEQLFQDSHSSQVTQLFSLQEGVGFGRARVSILFESVRMQLPQNLLGWNTATLEILSPITAELSDELTSYLKRKNKKLKLKTSEDIYKLPIVKSESIPTLDTSSAKIAWSNQAQITDYDDTLLRIPIYERYQSNVIFQISHENSLISSVIPGESKNHHISILCLQTLQDNVEKEIRLPILTGARLKNLSQNFISENTQATHNYRVSGFLSFKARVDPGLDPTHARYAQSSIARHTFEAYDNTEGQAEQAIRNAHALAHKKNYSETSNSSTSTTSIDHDRSFKLSKILGGKDDEQKEIERAHKKALSARHRGAMQYAPIRTSIWMKEGLEKRARELKNRIEGKVEKEPHIETEGRT